VLQESGDLVGAQNKYLEYTAEFRSHPSKVEVQLRQGLLYREMGMMGLALSKFGSVVSSALDLRVGDLERMERLVLRAKAEVGETYFLQGKYAEAASSFSRLLKQDSPLLNREALSYKLIQSLHRAQDTPGAVEQGQRFLVEFGGSEMEPEVRYILAKEFKLLGRAVDAKREILSLLQAESGRSRKDPAKWIYWQKLAGNEMANQLYAEGDFVATRTVYEHLAALDNSAAWQVPVWYQLGLVYERLGQRAKALEMYGDVLERETELTGASLTPSLGAVIEMARWRKDAVGWMEKAEGEVASLRQGPEK
jgi:tetratricopeptide (TPR) repeat protein